MAGAGVAPGTGMFPWLPREGAEAYSLPSAGVGSLVSSVKMEVGEKPLAAYSEPVGFLVHRWVLC